MLEDDPWPGPRARRLDSRRPARRCSALGGALTPCWSISIRSVRPALELPVRRRSRSSPAVVPIRPAPRASSILAHAAIALSRGAIDRLRCSIQASIRPMPSPPWPRSSPCSSPSAGAVSTRPEARRCARRRRRAAARRGCTCGSREPARVSAAATRAPIWTRSNVSSSSRADADRDRLPGSLRSAALGQAGGDDPAPTPSRDAILRRPRGRFRAPLPTDPSLIHVATDRTIMHGEAWSAGRGARRRAGGRGPRPGDRLALALPSSPSWPSATRPRCRPASSSSAGAWLRARRLAFDPPTARGPRWRSLPRLAPNASAPRRR